MRFPADPASMNKSARSERELLALASALAKPGYMPRGAMGRSQSMEAIRANVLSGADPLGEEFISIRSAEDRRKVGAIYTPASIVKAMLAWAGEQGQPTRVIDVGAGSGRFLMQAARVFPTARLLGIELDPLAAQVLRANLAIQGLDGRATVLEADYRSTEVPRVAGKTLFVGNPPYVRHHGIGEEWKLWYRDAAASFGIKASRLAGLHLHFFVRTAQLARPGDFGAFITSAEWLDVNYGAALRQLLVERLGFRALHVLEPAVAPFAGTATTGAITCFRLGAKPKSIRMRSVASVEALGGLTVGEEVPWPRVVAAARWTPLLRPAQAAVPAGYGQLGDIVRVSRGQVTGLNNVWIARDQARGLPDEFLAPTITKARELIAAGNALDDDSRLRRVVNLPSDLDEVDEAFRKAVGKFITWAKRQGAADGYVAKHRRAWWAVHLYEPAPMVCTYMARRPPAFVRNLCGARHLNIAHGLYPREPMGEHRMGLLLAYLRQHVGTAAGRTYAGGLTKFEPRELERIPIPPLEELDAGAAQVV